MRSVILRLFAALLFSVPAWATFTLTQVKGTSGGSGTSIAVTVTSTGAGHVLVIGTTMTDNVTISSVTTNGSGGTAVTLCGTNCQKGSAGAGWVDMVYTLNSPSAATTITINFSASTSVSVATVWEYSSTGTPAFDDGKSVLDTTCTTCVGTALTIGGSNDVISTVASCGQTCSGVSIYTADLAFANGNGAAHLLNSTSGTAPNWTQSPTGVLVSSAIAIKDASGGGGAATRSRGSTF